MLEFQTNFYIFLLTQLFYDITGNRKKKTHKSSVSKTNGVNGLLQCSFCDASVWNQEQMGKKGPDKVPSYTIYCQQG